MFPSTQLSEITKQWLAELSRDDAKLLRKIRTAVAYYEQAGWEAIYPYPDMPEWLKQHWWYTNFKPKNLLDTKSVNDLLGSR